MMAVLHWVNKVRTQSCLFAYAGIEVGHVDSALRGNSPGNLFYSSGKCAAKARSWNLHDLHDGR
jgi:hypothetical protein